MKNGNRSGQEAVAFGFLFLGMFTLVTFHDRLEQWGILLPVIIAVVVSFLGFFAWQIGKSWKQSDEAVLELEPEGEEDSPLLPKTKQPAYEDRKRFFFSAIAMAIFLTFREKQTDPAALAFSGIVLLSACIYFLPAWIQKRRGREGQPFFPKSRLQPDQLLQMFVNLVALCFACFWIYLVLSKTGLWWFSIPGFLLAFVFARPLVAGIRIWLRGEKDPGEKHINKRKDRDPWDRPDRKL